MKYLLITGLTRAYSEVKEFDSQEALLEYVIEHHVRIEDATVAQRMALKLQIGEYEAPKTVEEPEELPVAA